MEICIICESFIHENGTVLHLKGCEKINNVSIITGENVVAKIGDKVHENCRRIHVSENHIKSRLNSNKASNEAHNFSLETCCLFCGEAANINKKKKNSNVAAVVISEDFLQTIKNALKKRNDDEWAEEVSARIKSLADLIDAEALYHQNCRIGFRTNKTKPKSKNEVLTKSTIDYKQGFLEIVNLIQTNKRKQYSIRDLIDEMNVFSNGNAYSFNQMKTNLLKFFGDEIIISTFKNKKTLVTLRETSNEILDAFYESTRNENEKERILKRASDIIFEDIKKVIPNKDCYPSPSDISLTQAQKYLPESLLTLLSNIITGHKASLKIASIGQSIIQTAHRENVMAPLQIALAIQMYHIMGSKFLVNTLHSLGFCSSYAEVKKFQLCAWIALHENRLKASNENLPVIKYVGDNVDHNLRTLDGKGTFHGMGIISIHEPLTEKCTKIPRIKANLQDLKEMGMVDIIPYLEKMTPNTSLFYEKLPTNEIQDPYSHLDLLWKMSWSPGTTRPGWFGMMQMLQHGSHPKKPIINFLPIINMNPNDLTCISSTLHFICKDAEKFNATPLATFDQPLYWKARTIIENEAENSSIKRVVLSLGGFHLKMSFLGSIGHIMSGSGLDMALAEVYAENSVIHMMSGKAYARATRGFFMVDSALNSILFEDILKDEEVSRKVGDFYEKVMDGSQDVDKIQNNELLKLVELSFSKQKEKINDPTSRLWFQYMDMVDILKSNIRGDRTGNFQLHLQTILRMLRFFAAAGHNLYAKSAYMYLQDMRNLEKHNPSVFEFLSNGNFITRRTDRFWGGLADDLIIEQVLMRNLKIFGGPTHGRGMDETKLSLWLNSLPARAEVNNAMQDLTDSKFETSEQHKECGKSRVTRDNKDIDCIYNFLKERNPFAGTTPNALRNIADGVISTSKANVHKAEDIGLKVLQSLDGKNVFQFSFQKCQQVVQMSSKDEISINGEMVYIDPETLFHRLLLLILQNNGTEEEREGMFCYELCHKSPSLFDSNGLMREANSTPLLKTLVTNIGGIIDSNVEVEKLSNVVYVLEGDWIIDKIQWLKGESFDEICERYITYLKHKFKKATIVFVCNKSPSTNDESWLRKTKGVLGMEVLFSSDMSLKIKKEVFLRNKQNMQRFIELLGKKLEDNDFSVCIVTNDCINTMTNLGVHFSKIHNVVVVGKQVNLIMVLCFRAVLDNFSVFYMYEETSKKPLQVWNITEMRKRLGEVKSKHLLFAHVMGGCEKTSQLFGIGKASLFKKLDDAHFAKQAEIFCCKYSSKNSIIKAGNEAIVSLYNGKSNETLNNLRYRKFKEKTALGKSTITCKSLPPTEAAAKFHSLRVYYQIQIWMQNELNPLNYGWIEKNSILRPVSTNMPTAPSNILANIRCGCKTDCDSTRCTCFVNGLSCTTACKVCAGSSCSNCSLIEIDSDLDEGD